MMTRVFLILCCLGILVAGSGCYASIGVDGGYYPAYPRRGYHHHHYYPPRYYSPYRYRHR